MPVYGSRVQLSACLTCFAGHHCTPVCFIDSCTQHVLQPCLPVHHTDLTSLAVQVYAPVQSKHIIALFYCTALDRSSSTGRDMCLLLACCTSAVCCTCWWFERIPTVWLLLASAGTVCYGAAGVACAAFGILNPATPQLSWCGMIWSRQHRSSTISGKVFWLWRAAGNPVRTDLLYQRGRAV